MSDTQRITYVPLEAMTPDMRAEMERCAREGTPRPESSAIRAHVPAAFWFFANAWQNIFRDGVCDHAIKELCRVYISRTVKCEYCGNQRSEKGRTQGLQEGQYDDLVNFETSDRYDERQKAALAYAEAIAWHLETDDELWERLHAHFSEAELVELGCMIGLDLRPAELAAPPEHRAPRGARRRERVDGSGLRDCGRSSTRARPPRTTGRGRSVPRPPRQRRAFSIQCRVKAPSVNGAISS